MTSRSTDHSMQAQKLDLALDAWSRRKWLALLVFAAVASSTFTLARTLPNLYRAAATVLAQENGLALETLAAFPGDMWKPSECPLCAAGVPLSDESSPAAT